MRFAIECAASPVTGVLSEFMAAPDMGPEWVEVYNTADVPVSLLGWRIRDGAGKESDGLDAACIPTNGFAVISGGEPEFNVPSGVEVLRVGRFPSLNNDGDSVALVGYDGTVQDSMAFRNATSGASLELISPDRKGIDDAWSRCVDTGGSTPGRSNSIYFDESGSGTRKDVNLKVTPNPFEERTIISYSLPFALARVRLEVYDRMGRKAAVLRDGTDSGSKWETAWDGRSGGQRLSSGSYILVLEALDRSSGSTVTTRIPVVIARRL